MTREENIKAILECNFAGFKEEIIECATKTIMEVEQESCEDAISREEVIKLAKCFPMPIDVEDEGYVCISDIKKLLSVTPTRKVGKWIVNKERDTICCPYCHDKQKIGKDEVELLETAFARFNFCPNCGAEMESEE